MLRTVVFGLSLIVVAMLSAVLASPSAITVVGVRNSNDYGPTKEARVILLGAERTERELLKLLSHNLANAATPSFKSRYAATETVALDESGGTRVGAARTDFRQGELIDTDRDSDLAIFGRGFFQVALNDGALAYTRRGDLTVDAIGQLTILVNDRPLMLDPPITVPPESLSFRVDNEGVVSVQQPGQCEKSQVGQLQLALFINPEGLHHMGSGIYAETEESGTATLVSPSWQGAGEIRQGFLEASNVDVERTIEEYRDALARLRRVRQLLAN